MNCVNLKIRTKDYQKYIYCLKRREKINYSECKCCIFKEYKAIKIIKKQSKKQRKIESKRISILTNNMNVCYICGQRKKDDLHEIFGGCNRKKSIQWGLVIPVCRVCHEEWDINRKLKSNLQIVAQELFEKEHGHDMFMKEFNKDYKEKWRN